MLLLACLRTHTAPWPRPGLLAHTSGGLLQHTTHSLSPVCFGVGMLSSSSTIQVGGMCVAPAVSGVYTSGTRLVLAACNTTTAPLWQAGSAPNTNRIQATASATACIGATGSSVGSAVSIATCSTSDSQKWAVDSIGRLLPRNAMALCLDTEGGSLAAGARLVLSTCSGSAPSQLFYPPASGRRHKGGPLP